MIRACAPGRPITDHQSISSRSPRGRLGHSGYLSPINYHFTVPLVAALARLGVAHAAVTPGSRNTPLALALAQHPAIRDWAHHDERSAAFFSLGLAKATRTPVVVTCTSGTAVAELFPALTEARYGRVPLIALTADRPGNLVGTGAPQTIDQRGIFGPIPKWTGDVEVDADAADPVQLAGAMMAAAIEHPPGPVHLNLRFSEPLVPDGELPIPPPEPGTARMPAPPTRVEVPPDLAALLGGKRLLVICGPQDDPGLADVLTRWATEAGVPIIADPLSLLRAGPHDRSRVVACGDALSWSGFLDRARPEVVLRVGALPTSKPIWSWLADHPEVPQVLVDRTGWDDPTGRTRMVRADPAALFDRLGIEPAPPGWAERWAEADGAAAAALRDAEAALHFPTEPGIARAVAESIPSGSVLHAASSMPIRDLDTMFPSTERRVRITSNRGVNGIDGFLSSGLGIAAAGVGPTYLLAGDLSALHDLTAVATAARLGLPVLIVVINNDGGGIFHLLPQAGFEEAVFERHWGTPHGIDFVASATALGVAAEALTERGALTEAVSRPPDRPRLIELATDRKANVEVHRRLREAVSAAVRDS